MNLDTQDMELIKQTVKAAVAEATLPLVTKDEFQVFRGEVLDAHRQFYPREIVDIKLDELHGKLNALADETAKNKDVLSHLWENAWVKFICFAAGVAQLLELWALIQGR